jgi:hypothetical protein
MAKRIYVIAVLVGLGALYVGHDVLHRASQRRAEYRYRVFKLRMWYKSLHDYVEDGRAVPDTLYAYCMRVDDAGSHHAKVSDSDDGVWDKVLGHPELFAKEVQYELLRGNGTWYVREKNEGRYLHHMLMISNTGAIWMLQLRNDSSNGLD